LYVSWWSRFHQIFDTFYLWPWLGLSLLSRQSDALFTFGFVDDVMFLCNTGNRSESKTPFSSPGGDTGGEVCRLRLHLVVYVIIQGGAKNRRAAVCE